MQIPYGDSIDCDGKYVSVSGLFGDDRNLRFYAPTSVGAFLL